MNPIHRILHVLPSPSFATSLWLLPVLCLALATPSLAAGDTGGFLYGRITTRNDTVYTGALRWGREEAFWGDLFNSAKVDLPYSDYAPDDERREGRPIRVFGVKITVDHESWEASRQFIARFGDIREIRVFGGDEADVMMKNGTVYRVEGASNDIGADIGLRDPELGEIEVEWDQIRTIELLDTPRNLDLGVYRIHGTMKTTSRTFEGWIQWDSEECLSTDKIDGESRDGDMSIPMGNIRRIERAGRGGSIIELKTGRTVELENTNDVDHTIRGIFVEDPRYGRVKVSWDAFREVRFDDAGGSGPAYADFEAARELAGTVKERSGRTHRGRIVFDLDEAESWEFLNGDDRDVEYYIPFSLITSIEPVGSRASRVTLVHGETIELEDGQDVSDRNDGILIFGAEGARPAYVAFDEVDRIDFVRGNLPAEREGSD